MTAFLHNSITSTSDNPVVVVHVDVETMVSMNSQKNHTFHLCGRDQSMWLAISLTLCNLTVHVDVIMQKKML